MVLEEARARRDGPVGRDRESVWQLTVEGQPRPNQVAEGRRGGEEGPRRRDVPGRERQPGADQGRFGGPEAFHLRRGDVRVVGAGQVRPEAGQLGPGRLDDGARGGGHAVGAQAGPGQARLDLEVDAQPGATSPSRSPLPPGRERVPQRPLLGGHELHVCGRGDRDRLRRDGVEDEDRRFQARFA